VSGDCFAWCGERLERTTWPRYLRGGNGRERPEGENRQPLFSPWSRPRRVCNASLMRLTPSLGVSTAPTVAATSGPWAGLATSFAAPVAQWGAPPTGQAPSTPWDASPVMAAVPPQWGPPLAGPAVSTPWGAPPAAAAATPPMGAYPEAPVWHHSRSCACALCHPVAGC